MGAPKLLDPQAEGKSIVNGVPRVLKGASKFGWPQAPNRVNPPLYLGLQYGRNRFYIYRYFTGYRSREGESTNTYLGKGWEGS